MKKIIAIISCIAVLSAVFVLSAFAYERTEEINFETLDISEREERTENIENIRSVSSIDTGISYIYNGNDYIYNLGDISNYTENISGTYSGTSTGGDNIEWNFDSIFIQSSTSNTIIQIKLGVNTREIYYKNGNQILSGIGTITFNDTISNQKLNQFFQNTCTINSPMNDAYDNTSDFLGFITDTLTDLVDYMVTNNLILIAMAIVIVSLGIGVLIRITKVK